MAPVGSGFDFEDALGGRYIGATVRQHGLGDTAQLARKFIAEAVLQQLATGVPGQVAVDDSAVRQRDRPSRVPIDRGRHARSLPATSDNKVGHSSELNQFTLWL